VLTPSRPRGREPVGRATCFYAASA
jgi:hypothetical protein